MTAADFTPPISHREALKVAHGIAFVTLSSISQMLDDKRPEDRPQIEAALLVLADDHFARSK